MGKPAARLLDMTAHGGMIAGPGCPTVLIGKMPAARMTDMHVCPMLTGVVPHGGGPLVGPVPPTVFIGKLPAACMGDMAICVGPPSSVLPPGSPTVLLGCAGGGGGGGGGGAATAAQAGQVLKSATVKSVKGTEAFPIELQQQLAEAAQYQSPEEIELRVKVIDDALKQGSGGEVEESNGTELTIADIVEILKEIENEEGYEAARHFASYLDYSTLTAMAMGGTGNNDPNRMPTRFMLLWGADDTKLTEADEHPDNFEEADSHTVNVGNLRKALRALGYDIAESGPYDNDVLRAHSAYIAAAWGQCEPAPEEPYVTQESDTLGEIAEVFGLASWKYLYEQNKDAIGDNPDQLKPGIDLTIPAWNHTSGEEKIAAKGAIPFRYVGGVRYAYPWVPYSVTLLDRSGAMLQERDADGELRGEFAEEKEFVIRDESGKELARGSIARADAIEVLVPDTPVKMLEVDGQEYD